MRRRFLILFRVGLLILGCALVAAPVCSDEVDDFVRATMEEQNIPGISIAVVRDGKRARVQGYGLANIELEVPVTPDTIFQSGSLGKQFTAAGILLLAEEGKLKLDDPLALHFPRGPATWHRITIRHLLNHTSGISDSQDDAYEPRRDYTEEEFLKISWKFPLEFTPGSQWSYCDTGYMILGILTSKLAGMHWSEYQKQRIFEPAGMTTAHSARHQRVGHRQEPGRRLRKERRGRAPEPGVGSPERQHHGRRLPLSDGEGSGRLGCRPARAADPERGQLRRVVDTGVTRRRHHLPVWLRLVAE
jgi:CubicO group peptidase (beta-lactamase class C family)